MNVKTFQGPSMADALAKVKQELGTSAVILHTRSFKQGGVMGLGARNVVEITASVNVNVNARKKQAAAVAIAGSRGRAQESTAGTAVAERHPLRSAYALNKPTTNRFAESSANSATR